MGPTPTGAFTSLVTNIPTITMASSGPISAAASSVFSSAMSSIQSTMSSAAPDPAQTSSTGYDGIIPDFGTGQVNGPLSVVGSVDKQSGLDSQLLISSSVGLFCFLVFCVVRTRIPVIFAPRMNMKKHRPPELPSSLFGWVIPLIRISQEQLLDNVGLDAVVLIQFLVMGIKLFGICSVFGLTVLVPISMQTGNATNPNITAVNRLSITVIDESSNSLIAYLVFTYIFTFFTFYFLQQNYDSHIYLRAKYLIRLSKTLTARSVIVTGIPEKLRSDRELAEYFEHLNIGSVESCYVVRHITNLNKLLKKRLSALKHLERAYATYWGNPCRIPDYDPDLVLEDAKMLKRVEKLTQQAIEHEENTSSTAMLMNLIDPKKRGTQSHRPQVKTGFLGLFGAKVDAIEYYTNMFDELDKRVIEARQSNDFEMTNVGFVTFKNMASALIVSQIAISPTPFVCRTVMAYEPRDVLWNNVTIRGRERLVREVVVWTITIALAIFWVIPIAALASLTSIDVLEKLSPSLAERAKNSTLLFNLLQGVIPTLLVNIFMAILPLIIDFLGKLQGIRARSALAETTFSKYFFFLLFNVLLVFAIVNTVTSTLVTFFNNPKDIVNVLGEKLPAVSPFFINYTILQGFLLMPLNLLLLGPLIVRGFKEFFICKSPREYARNRVPSSFNYGVQFPAPLLIFIIVLVYSTISPLILVFGTVYFAITYFVYKYRFLYVHFTPYETSGKLWVMVFPRVIVGLLLFQLTMLGIFILKKFFTLAILCVPLMILTILFKLMIDSAYLKNSRFLPMQLLRDNVMQLPISDKACLEKRASTPLSDTTQTSDSTNINRKRWRKATAAALMVNNQTSFATLDEPSSVHHRRVALDEDDYEAVPDKKTDYRQPPVTLNPGVLDTGLKHFGNPALKGVLPQLWLPIKLNRVGQQAARPPPHKRIGDSHLATNLAQMLRRAESAKRKESDKITKPGSSPSLDASGEKGALAADKFIKTNGPKTMAEGLKHRPNTGEGLESEQSKNTRRSSRTPMAISVYSLDEKDDDSDNSDLQAGLHATYYHHPSQRRHSMGNLDPQRPNINPQNGDSAPAVFCSTQSPSSS
ncbi:hypothetical protein CLU79DRAFT_836505 [Phycomyces nitens]|nr:hypothetical protein CLU79DRAFT_836505 [Phycomyces nitens]